MVARFYRIFYGVEIAVSRHVGYTQGDEWALISFDTPEWRKLTGVSDSVTIAECQNTEIADWARGDAFGVVHEELVSTCNNPNHGEWQEVDGHGSLWGFYGSPWDAETLDYVAESMGVELKG